MADRRAIRPARLSDAAALAAIYAPSVEGSAVSFEARPPDAAEMRRRLRKSERGWPWLVLEESGKVLGYAYAGPHREREAYRWSAETSVYVHPEHRGEGVGRALYAALLKRLRALGFYNAYAGITLPNRASVGLHEALGFRRVGVYRRVGYKLGAWRDVGWWQLRLRKAPVRPPAPPRVIHSFTAP